MRQKHGFWDAMTQIVMAATLRQILIQYEAAYGVFHNHSPGFFGQQPQSKQDEPNRCGCS
jgi:hypothetical protein